MAESLAASAYKHKHTKCMTAARNAVSERRRPLTRVRVLVGRARHQAGALSAGLRMLGATVIEIPFIEIRPPRSYKPLDSALKRLQHYDWMVLTSANGVEAVWHRMRELRISKASLRHLRVAAIGPATRKAIEARGLSVDVMPKQYVAEAVVRSLRRHVRKQRVLLARARVARDVIPRELRQAGAEVDVVEAYEAVLPKDSRARLIKLLKDQKWRPDVVTFSSSSMVRNFLTVLDAADIKDRGRGRPRHTDILDGIRFASIGPITSSTLRELGFAVHIEAKEYTIPGLIRAIREALS
jgi:uroporphyrinogen-III synthase